jgi:hypothetical protein
VVYWLLAVVQEPRRNFDSLLVNCAAKVSVPQSSFEIKSPRGRMLVRLNVTDIRAFNPAFQHKNWIPHSNVHERSFQCMYFCRYRWPRGLRRGSTAAYLLGLWLRVPPGVWTSVSCDCCVLWGRGFYIGLSPVQRSTTECDHVAVKGGHDRGSGRSVHPPSQKKSNFFALNPILRRHMTRAI